MDDAAGARRGAVRDRIFDGGLVGLAALAGIWPAVYSWQAPDALPVSGVDNRVVASRQIM